MYDDYDDYRYGDEEPDYVPMYYGYDEEEDIDELKHKGYVEVGKFTKSWSDYSNTSVNFKVISGDCKEVTVDRWFSGEEIALYCKPGSVVRYFELKGIDDPESGRSLDEQEDGLIIVDQNGKVDEYRSYYVGETGPFGSNEKKVLADVCKLPHYPNEYVKEYCNDVEKWLENM